MDKDTDRIVISMMILVLALAWGFLIYGREECEAKGGTYVKTMGGLYKCLDTLK